VIPFLYGNVFHSNVSKSSAFKANFIADDAVDKITISEINYHSSNNIDAGDWIEFWNYSQGRTIDISGWYFKDDNDTHRYIFPANTTLTAGSGIIVVNDKQKFESNYPAIPHLSAFDFELGDSGDAVRLFDSNNKLITSVAYKNNEPWPTDAGGTGRTLELKAPNVPPASSESWFAGCFGGSPGTAFTSPCYNIVTAVDDEVISQTCVLYPNPTQGKFILSSQTEPLNISVYDFSGKIIYLNTKPEKVQAVDLTDYGKGIYLVKVMLKNATQHFMKVAKN
jgi:hypothetical protein